MAAPNATAGLDLVQPSEGGSIHAMWIPCVVFAHVFAGWFLARMLLVMYPKAGADLRARLARGGKRVSPDALQREWAMPPHAGAPAWLSRAAARRSGAACRRQAVQRRRPKHASPGRPGARRAVHAGR